MKKFFLLTIGVVSLLLSSCSKDGDVNVFSVKKDIELGMQLDQQIMSEPQNYPILPEATHPEAYRRLRAIRDKILASDDITYPIVGSGAKREFEWKVTILDQDVLNAFAAPGGYIYVYTGIINYLDNENEFAGVLGHEIAHADKRHSTDQMTQDLGVTVMLQLALGQGDLATVAGSLIGLNFSRKHEAEADKFSVIYLCDTDYKANGAAGFFEKINAEGGSNGPTFLSTHPNPENRVKNINAKEVELGCEGTVTTGDYAAFKASLK